ncbi:efflux RND transporter permease subunit [Thermomonas sp. LB-4]|uniref:efflux RND transporter permease subunit n=1 Tax=Thermomonas sp. LB-4 TaxID=3102790 RepID=UPI002EDA1E60
MSGRRHHAHGHDRSRPHANPAPANGGVIDPVCGMQVDPATTPHRAGRAGTTYQFCSARCREKFIADPAHFPTPSPNAAVAGTLYVCPLHPEIRQLMTVVAIMAGLLPIMWSHGTGSEIMRRIAAPMVGGMVSSTVLTLVVIPVIYALVKQRGARSAG